MIFLLTLNSVIRRHPGKCALALLLLVLAVGGLLRSCRRDDPVVGIDLKAIERINSENEQVRREAVREVIRKNEEVRSLDEAQIRAIERRIEDASRIERKILTGEDLERIIRENR